MLARQFIKYMMKIKKKLLIAECEKPLTIMSALYLSHKFGVLTLWTFRLYSKLALV